MHGKWCAHVEEYELIRTLAVVAGTVVTDDNIAHVAHLACLARHLARRRRVTAVLRRNRRKAETERRSLSDQSQRTMRASQGAVAHDLIEWVVMWTGRSSCHGVRKISEVVDVDAVQTWRHSLGNHVGRRADAGDVCDIHRPARYATPLHILSRGIEVASGLDLTGRLLSDCTGSAHAHDRRDPQNGHHWSTRIWA